MGDIERASDTARIADNRSEAVEVKHCNRHSNDSEEELSKSKSINGSPKVTALDILEGNEDGNQAKSKLTLKVFKSFSERISELKSFKLQHGHCRVPSKFDVNPSMSAWCANLKQSYRLIQEGRKPILKLTHENINALEEIGFEWKYNVRVAKDNVSTLGTDNKNIIGQNDVIEEKISVSSPSIDEEPVDVSKQNDISIVSSLTEESDNEKSTDEQVSPPSTETVTSSKKRKVESKQSTTSNKKARKERSISFVGRLKELKGFKEKHGHCRVSRNDTNYYSLGSWCHNIRGSYRATQKQDKTKTQILSSDKISALDSIGFNWTMKEPRQMKSFDQRLQDLVVFKESFGHTRVPTGYEKNPSLAYWCNNVRNAYKMKNSGKKQYIALSEDRINSLEAIGFEFGRRNRSKNEACKSSKASTKKVPNSENNMTALNSELGKKVEVVEQHQHQRLEGLEGGVGPIIFI